MRRKGHGMTTRDRDDAARGGGSGLTGISSDGSAFHPRKAARLVPSHTPLL